MIYRRLIYANEKPFDNDDQEQKIPGKMREYMELNQKLKQKRSELQQSRQNNPKEKKKRFLNAYETKADERGAEVTVRAAPEFIKKTNESDISFLNRIDQVCKTEMN